MISCTVRYRGNPRAPPRPGARFEHLEYPTLRHLCSAACPGSSALSTFNCPIGFTVADPAHQTLPQSPVGRQRLAGATSWDGIAPTASFVRWKYPNAQSALPGSLSPCCLSWFPTAMSISGSWRIPARKSQQQGQAPAASCTWAYNGGKRTPLALVTTLTCSVTGLQTSGKVVLEPNRWTGKIIIPWGLCFNRGLQTATYFRKSCFDVRKGILPRQQANHSFSSSRSRASRKGADQRP